MFKKQVGHFVTVSMKFFFDFDISVFSHALFAVIILLGFIKLLFVILADNLYDGLLTVKEDAQLLQQEVAAYKQKWENSPVRETLINNVRSFRENLAEIDVSNWRLK